MQIRGKEPCAELIRRLALRGSFSARNRQQRKAVAEVTEPDAPGVQHLAAPGVGAEARQLVTQEELGNLIGVQRAQISRIENGKNLTFSTIARVFKAMGISAKLEIGSMGKVALW